jgi:hypothetical protein
MTRHSVLAAALLAVAGAVSPLAAQKAPPASTQQPAAAAPIGAAPSAKVLHPAPAVTPPAAPSPQAAAPSAADSAVAPPVTPQAVRPVPAAAGTYSAGLAVGPYTGTTSAAALAYAARFAHLLDTTIVSLVGTFRNTLGQPVIGARNPSTLSQRERDRWMRCRDFYWDLRSYHTAIGPLRASLPSNPSLQLAAAQLDSALSASTAMAECDNVASMIDAPSRWSPWLDSYEAAARRFYGGFYGQIRTVHERDRALVYAIDPLLPPSERLPMPAGLPPTPPFAGAGPN